MKAARGDMKQILHAIGKRGCVLMLDFDGVLSPIVRRPADARISAHAQTALRTLARHMPVAVISGRTLADVKRRVGIPDIAYAGKHGMEWEFEGRRSIHRIDTVSLRRYGKARDMLLSLRKHFPGLVMEDKRSCLAMNYRGLRRSQAAAFRRAAHARLAPFLRTRAIRILDDNKTLEIVPFHALTKGDSALRLYGLLRTRNEIPVFIGDSLTDEDAFKAFRRGITIRVGHSRASRARYFFKKRADVDFFLGLIIKLPAHA